MCLILFYNHLFNMINILMFTYGIYELLEVIPNNINIGCIITKSVIIFIFGCAPIVR